MDSPITAFHMSDCYSVFDYTCTCTECGRTAMEYIPEFTISFPRSGFYRFNSYKREEEMYNGVVRLEKPRTEYCITHVNPFPDSTTFITLEPAFFERLYEDTQLGELPFFKDPDQHSMSLPAQPYWELLLDLIVQNTKHGRRKGSLYTDCLVMELLQSIFTALRARAERTPELSFDLKKAHCDTIERAKIYLSEHLNEDISLADIARQALVSPFHFTRIFKSFTGFSPWDYLSRQRLSYAALLLKNNTSLVSEVAIQAGFNSTAHFTASFPGILKQALPLSATLKSKIPKVVTIPAALHLAKSSGIMHFSHPIFLNHLEFLRAYRGRVTQEPECFAVRSDRAAFSLAFPFPSASIERLSFEWDTVYLMPESMLLEKPLLEYGYKHIRSFDYRSMPLRELDWAVQAQVEVRLVGTDADMEDFSEVQARGFCETEPEYREWHPWMRAANFRNKNNATQRFYVGYMEGRPAGVALANHFAGVTGIYAVATIPDMRKQGISTTIMEKALSDAGKIGLDTAVLQVVEGSFAAAFYQKLGFQTQFTVKILSRL